MSSDTVELDTNSATRPSSPRGRGVTPPVAADATIGTTLPMISWGEAGAILSARTMDRYETLDRIGEGGMGEVVRARDNDIGREVAVKRLRPEHQNAELYARFVEEVRTVGQLEHPNIVPIHDAGLDAQGYYFVMKHLQGDTLEQIIGRLDRGDKQTHAQWPLERRVAVIRKVLEAVRYAHSKGVIHRDIKPANILVGAMGEVFLLDWGIARRERRGPEASTASTQPAAGAGTQVGAVMGTPLYMSPEQARGDPADARSDLYSLCLTFYEFLTLRHPFAGIENTAKLLQAVLVQKISHGSTVKHPHQAAVPMELGWLTLKGVAKDPAARYQTAEEFIRRLDDRAEGKVPIQCHITATRRMSYEVMKLINRSPVAYTLVLLAGIGGGLFWVFG